MGPANRPDARLARIGKIRRIRRMFRFTKYVLVFLLAPQATIHAGDSPMNDGNARVVLVGDSITGLSRNYATGFAKQMDWALQEVHPGCKPDIVALGGSGQGVPSWLEVESRSRTQVALLDVPGIDVKATLAQPADILVIMLGMNDVLLPHVADDADLKQWETWYRELISNLQARVHPKVTALATASLCTEDINAPQNRMMDKLNTRAEALAKEMGLRVLPVNATMREVLHQGRRRAPDFHVTYDFVHPNESGHIAVAMAMLRGLGETKAAERLAKQRLPQAIEKATGAVPSLSHEIVPLTFSNDGRQVFRVTCWLNPTAGTPGRMRLRLSGDGWEVKPAIIDAAEGEFTVTGKPDHSESILKLEGTAGPQTLTQEVRIPAPWLVTAGIQRPFWTKDTFDAAKARGPVDEAIAKGRDFTQVPGMSWQRYFPSVNFTGGAVSGNVDFYAITHPKKLDAGYAARWIYSDHDRAVKVNLGSKAFACTMHLIVSLNGTDIYNGLLTAEPDRNKTLETRLHKGWNTLVVNSNHTQWQWQFSAELEGTADDTLPDLRYAISPQ